MRDITDFLIIGVITGVIAVISILQARKEQDTVESVSEVNHGQPVRKAS